MEEFKWHEPHSPSPYDPEYVQAGDKILCLELDRTFLFTGSQFIVWSRIGGAGILFPKEKGIKLLKGKTLAVCHAAVNE